MKGISSKFVHKQNDIVPRCHASSIVELENGDFLCGFYGGSGESNVDEANFFSRLKKGTDRWMPIRAFAKFPGHAMGNIRFFHYGKSVCVIYAANFGKWCRGGSRLYFATSEDYGYTWSEPKHIEVDIPVLGKNKGIVLKNGSILLPLTYEPTELYVIPPTGVLISEDGGATWQRYGDIRAEDNCWVLQGTCVENEDDSILMLLRSTGGRIYSVVGTDGGKNWPEVATRTELPNNHSGIDMTRLKDGNLVLAFNNQENEELRTPLNSALSTDNGETWPYMITLEDGEGEYSYPAIIQDSEGLIHVTYTYLRTHIKHITFSEDIFS